MNVATVDVLKSSQLLSAQTDVQSNDVWYSTMLKRRHDMQALEVEEACLDVPYEKKWKFCLGGTYFEFWMFFRNVPWNMRRFQIVECHRWTYAPHSRNVILSRDWKLCEVKYESTYAKICDPSLFRDGSHGRARTLCGSTRGEAHTEQDEPMREALKYRESAIIFVLPT